MNIKDISGPDIKSVFGSELQQEILCYNTQFFEKGTIVTKQDSYVKKIPLVIRGHLKVCRHTEEREILLYHIAPLETCMYALISILEVEIIKAEIVAAEDSEIIMIPYSLVNEWKKKYDSWNNFVFYTFVRRQNQILKSIDSIAFSSIDGRIKIYLAELTQIKKNNIINITHQEIANDLGTTRVVISRILKNLELQGVIELLRGSIRVKSLNFKI